MRGTGLTKLSPLRRTQLISKSISTNEKHVFRHTLASDSLLVAKRYPVGVNHWRGSEVILSKLYPSFARRSFARIALLCGSKKPYPLPLRAFTSSNCFAQEADNATLVSLRYFASKATFISPLPRSASKQVLAVAKLYPFHASTKLAAKSQQRGLLYFTSEAELLATAQKGVSNSWGEMNIRSSACTDASAITNPFLCGSKKFSFASKVQQGKPYGVLLRTVKGEMNLVRPLLFISRFEIKKICSFWRLPLYPDTSNQTVKFLRNRVRQQLSPTIKFFFNSKIENSFLQLAEIVEAEDYRLTEIVNKFTKNTDVYDAKLRTHPQLLLTPSYAKQSFAQEGVSNSRQRFASKFTLLDKKGNKNSYSNLAKLYQRSVGKVRNSINPLLPLRAFTSLPYKARRGEMNVALKGFYPITPSCFFPLRACCTNPYRGKVIAERSGVRRREVEKLSKPSTKMNSSGFYIFDLLLTSEALACFARSTRSRGVKVLQGIPRPPLRFASTDAALLAKRWRDILAPYLPHRGTQRKEGAFTSKALARSEAEGLLLAKLNSLQSGALHRQAFTPQGLLYFTSEAELLAKLCFAQEGVSNSREAEKLARRYKKLNFDSIGVRLPNINGVTRNVDDLLMQLIEINMFNNNVFIDLDASCKALLTPLFTVGSKAIPPASCYKSKICTARQAQRGITSDPAGLVHLRIASLLRKPYGVNKKQGKESTAEPLRGIASLPLSKNTPLDLLYFTSEALKGVSNSSSYASKELDKSLLCNWQKLIDRIAFQNNELRNLSTLQLLAKRWGVAERYPLLAERRYPANATLVRACEADNATLVRSSINPKLSKTRIFDLAHLDIKKLKKKFAKEPKKIISKKIKFISLLYPLRYKGRSVLAKRCLLLLTPSCAKQSFARSSVSLVRYSKPSASFTSEALIPRQRCASKGLAKQIEYEKALRACEADNATLLLHFRIASLLLSSRMKKPYLLRTVNKKQRGNQVGKSLLTPLTPSGLMKLRAFTVTSGSKVIPLLASYPYGLALLYKSSICNSWLNGKESEALIPLLCASKKSEAGPFTYFTFSCFAYPQPAVTNRRFVQQAKPRLCGSKKFSFASKALQAPYPEEGLQSRVAKLNFLQSSALRSETSESRSGQKQRLCIAKEGIFTSGPKSEAELLTPNNYSTKMNPIGVSPFIPSELLHFLYPFNATFISPLRGKLVLTLTGYQKLGYKVSFLLAKRCLLRKPAGVKGNNAALLLHLRFASLLRQPVGLALRRWLNKKQRACCTNPYRVHFSGVIAEQSVAATESGATEVKVISKTLGLRKELKVIPTQLIGNKDITLFYLPAFYYLVPLMKHYYATEISFLSFGLLFSSVLRVSQFESCKEPRVEKNTYRNSFYPTPRIWLYSLQNTNTEIKDLYFFTFFLYFFKLRLKNRWIYWPNRIVCLPLAFHRRLIKLFLLKQNKKNIRYSKIDLISNNILAMS